MTYWLQQLVIAIVLLASILLLTLAPARLVLLPLWPLPVEEVVIASGDAQAGERAFVVPNGPLPTGRLVARDRPLSLVAVEPPNQPVVHGFVVGIRPAPEAPLEALPGEVAAMTVPVSDWSYPIEAVLVLMQADETVVEMALSDIARLYAPNRMSLAERSTLAWQRLIPRWRERRWRDASETGDLANPDSANPDPGDLATNGQAMAE